MFNRKLWLCLWASICLAGCSQAYYGTMEKFGVHKREILVDRVEDARDAQEDGEKQFKDALAAFKSVTGFDGGNLEKVYDKLNGEYQDSKDAADDISERIEAIESVANAMFSEWRAELKQYSSANLRRDSEQQLKLTQAKYKQLIGAMRKAEARIDPVLAVMQDQVLYLKHNLNARAIQSLKSEVPKIDANVDSLVAAMRQAIAEADAFVANMKN